MSQTQGELPETKFSNIFKTIFIVYKAMTGMVVGWKSLYIFFFPSVHGVIIFIFLPLPLSGLEPRQEDCQKQVAAP